MDNFSYAENIGRTKFQALLDQKGITDYQFTPDQFNPVDCYFTQGVQWVAEIKVRNREYPTLFMELSKLKSMIQIIKEGEAQNGLYVNFIGDKCFIFDIREICKNNKENHLKIQQKWLPRTTAEDSDYVYKDVIELPIGWAQCLIYKEGKYDKAYV